MAQRYNNSAGHTNKSFVYAVMQGLCGPATEKSGCAPVWFCGFARKESGNRDIQVAPFCLDSCDRRYCLYSLTSNSLMSTSSKSAILSRQATSGWEVLVHHLLTVDGLTPSCSESHLLVRFFSKRTIFILFTSSIFIAVLCYKDSDFVSRYAIAAL